MALVFGAVKGIWRAAILLVIAVLVPTTALIVASYTNEFLGLDFTTAFVLVLGLEALFAIAAFFGIVSEVQESHNETINRPLPSSK